MKEKNERKQEKETRRNERWTRKKDRWTERCWITKKADLAIVSDERIEHNKSWSEKNGWRYHPMDGQHPLNQGVLTSLSSLRQVATVFSYR